MGDLKVEIAKYCHEHIENYDLKAELAFDIIDKWRCDLHTASGLYEEIADCIEEFCEDHELDSEDFDVEEIFWTEI